MRSHIRKTRTAALAVLVGALASLHAPAAALAEDIGLPGLHAQSEIQLTCQASGGRYFEDLDFGNYGCTNESRRSGLECRLLTLTCTLRLPDQLPGRRL